MSKITNEGETNKNTKKDSKRELILDAMQRLLYDNKAQTISVSDVAREANIGKGSVYYYFKSKEDILNAVIERSYSDVIEKGKQLAKAPELGALTKMEIIFRTCIESSVELSRQEANNYFELQQTALLHQQYIKMMVQQLRPILSDVIRQGNEQGALSCQSPDEIAEIVLIILTIKLDTQISGTDKDALRRTLRAFASMLEDSFSIEHNKLNFLVDF